MIRNNGRGFYGAAVALAALSGVLIAAGDARAQLGTLEGFARLPAATFRPDSPTSGQFIGGGANGIPAPFADQPIQGVSSVMSAGGGQFYALPDNGYGSQTNSADFILGYYTLTADFRTTGGGTGNVGFNGFTAFRDPNGFLLGNSYVTGGPVYSRTNYPNGAGNIPVDPVIVSQRLLTGYDLDPESFRRVSDGSFWVGDEFGPYLLHFGADGSLLEAPFALPGVFAPQNPANGGTPNLPSSNGFEGMALTPDGQTLYALLEGTVAGDPANTLRINPFDLTSKQFTGTRFFYQLEQAGNSIGDITSVDNNRYIVIERDNGQGASALFKRLYLADFTGVPNGGTVQKTLLLDLLNIADPNDLNLDSSATFTFPFLTIESVAILDSSTVLVVNDNNLPSSTGRTPGVADSTEFIRVRLNASLTSAPEPSPLGLLTLVGITLKVGRRYRTGWHKA